MKEIEKFVHYVLDQKYLKTDRALIKTELTYIKGYITTKVYRLKVKLNDKTIDVFYIKESGDRSLDKFNQFIETEYENTKFTSDQFNDSDCLKVVRPVLYSSNHKALLLEEIQGVRLDKVIFNNILKCQFEAIENHLLLCKDWINEFQKIKPEDFDIEFIFKQNERRKIDRLKERILNIASKKDMVFFKDIFDRLIEAIENFDVKNTDKKIKHNDFAPWNIILNQGGITVFDFADCGIDYKYFDLMYFWHSLGKIGKKIPFSKYIMSRYQSFFLGQIDIRPELINYYATYFYLQDIEAFMRKLKKPGLKRFKDFFNFRHCKSKLKSLSRNC